MKNHVDQKVEGAPTDRVFQQQQAMVPAASNNGLMQPVNPMQMMSALPDVAYLTSMVQSMLGQTAQLAAQLQPFAQEYGQYVKVSERIKYVEED